MVGQYKQEKVRSGKEGFKLHYHLSLLGAWSLDPVELSEPLCL
jgi:hypothetical protein